MGSVGLYIDLENILYSLINNYNNVSLDIKGKLRNPTEVLKIIRNKATEYGGLVHCEAFYCKGEKSIIEGIAIKDMYWDKNELFRALNDLMIESRDIYQRQNPFTKKPTKNLADNYLIVTVMKHIFELPIIDTFIIVAGDGGYFPLYREIIQRSKKLVVMTLEISYADWLEDSLALHEAHRIFLDELLEINTKLEPQVIPDSSIEQEEDRLSVGDILDATIVGLNEEGASVRLKNDEEAFLSKWDMSWHWIDNPVRIFKKDQQIKVQILDVTNSGIWVGYRQLENLPMTEEEIPKTRPVEVEVMMKTDEEAILKMENRCYGYVNSGDILWTNMPLPLNKLEVGQKVKAKLLKFDLKREKGWIHFGIKQIIQNPWDDPAYIARYKEGMTVFGNISRFIADPYGNTGAAVDLELTIEGIIWLPGVANYAKNIAKKKSVQSVTQVLEVGKRVKSTVWEFDDKHRRIILTLEDVIAQNEI